MGVSYNYGCGISVPPLNQWAYHITVAAVFLSLLSTNGHIIQLWLRYFCPSSQPMGISYNCGCGISVPPLNQCAYHTTVAAVFLSLLSTNGHIIQLWLQYFRHSSQPMGVSFYCGCCVSVSPLNQSKYHTSVAAVLICGGPVEVATPGGKRSFSTFSNLIGKCWGRLLASVITWMGS